MNSVTFMFHQHNNLSGSILTPGVVVLKMDSLGFKIVHVCKHELITAGELLSEKTSEVESQEHS